MSDATLPVGDRGAAMSPCGRYRYSLWRRWDASKPTVLFVMLNPSTADADTDDPTIRKCIGFAKRWGYGTLLVGNLYALRATDPRELDTAPAPVGRDNTDALYRLAGRADRVVAAWGAKPNRGRYGRRAARVLDGLHDHDVYALRLTKDGHPWHPLYVPYCVEPIVYGGPDA
jgi:hypothetical protein